MKEEQFAELISALKIREPVEVRHDMPDILSKIGIAVCTAAILWVASQIQAQDRKLIMIESNQNHLKVQVEKVSNFTKEPRFTKEDFNIEMRLYQRRLDIIEQEVKYRSQLMNDKSKRFNPIE